MSTTKSYTPAQAAQLLNVHPNTIRKWIDEFGDVLSESARSRPRILRESDIAVLQIAAQLRSEGISVADTLTRLREIPIADRQSPIIDASSTPVDASTTPTEGSTQLPATVDIRSVLGDMVAVVVDERIRSVDERLTQVEKGRSVWTGVAIGIAVGVVLGVILAAALLRL